MKGDQITPKVWQLDSNKSRAVILYEEENAMPLVGHPSFMHGSKRGLRPEQESSMTTRQVSTAPTRTPDTPDTPATRLQGHRLLLARAIWLLLVVITVGIFVANIPNSFDLLRSYASDHHASLVQFGLSDTFFALYFMTFDLACMLVFSLTALMIFWRRSDDWMAMFTSLALVTFGASYTFFLFAMGRLQSPQSLPLTLVQALGLGSSIIFYYLFPTGQFVPQWTRVLAIVFVAWALTWLIYPAASLLHWPFLLSYVVMVVFYGRGVLAQLYRYRRVSDAIERQQTKLVVFGVTVTAVGLSGFTLFRFLSPAIFSQTLIDMVGIPFIVLCELFVPVTIGIAMLRYRLWEVDPMINRVLVYSTLTGMLAAVYFGSIIGLQSLLRGLFNQTSDVAIVISTLFSAALFQPLRRGIQAIIDRRFYRRKYDAAKTLEAFSATLRSEVDLNELREHVLAVVQETMQPTHVSLWLRPPEPSRQRNTQLRPPIDEEER